MAYSSAELIILFLDRAISAMAVCPSFTPAQGVAQGLLLATRELLHAPAILFLLAVVTANRHAMNRFPIL